MQPGEATVAGPGPFSMARGKGLPGAASATRALSGRGSDFGPIPVPAPALDRLGRAAEVDRGHPDLRIGLYMQFRRSTEAKSNRWPAAHATRPVSDRARGRCG